MYENCLQQWEQNTFARLRDLSDKLRNETHQQLETYQNSKQAELTVDREVLNYEERITDRIRVFVQQEKDKSEQGEMLALAEEDLRKLFESQMVDLDV